MCLKFFRCFIFDVKVDAAICVFNVQCFQCHYLPVILALQKQLLHIAFLILQSVICYCIILIYCIIFALFILYFNKLPIFCSSRL